MPGAGSCVCGVRRGRLGAARGGFVQIFGLDNVVAAELFLRDLFRERGLYRNVAARAPNRRTACHAPDESREILPSIRHRQIGAGVADSRLDFGARADNAGICEQPRDVRLAKLRHDLRLETLKRLAEGFALPQDRYPQESFFVISPTAAPDSLHEVLSLAYDQAGRVRKHRTLYLVGRTRVHLDRVENLGHFLELEVVLSEGESPEAGVEEAHSLMASLGITNAQLIEGAYVDLLAQQLP